MYVTTYGVVHTSHTKPTVCYVSEELCTSHVRVIVFWVQS